jgi:hypothetical protein
MLVRLFPFLAPSRIKPDFATRLRRLADDCERLELGLPVSELELAKAPLLEDWAPTVMPQGLRLVGYAIDHPAVGEGAVMTSPLCLADPEGRWVRTIFRFWRLGNPIALKDIRRTLRTSGVIRADEAGSEDET